MIIFSHKILKTSTQRSTTNKGQLRSVPRSGCYQRFHCMQFSVKLELGVSHQFVSCYSPYIKVNSLKKSFSSVVFSSKTLKTNKKTQKINKRNKKKKKRNKRQDNGNQEYQVIISNYNFKYPDISNCFYYVIITNNLQNLRFYQCSLKNVNEIMFCTKTKLLTQKTVLKVILFQIFYQCRLL